MENILQRYGAVEVFGEWRTVSVEKGDWVPICFSSEDVPALLKERSAEIMMSSTTRQRKIAESF